MGRFLPSNQIKLTNVAVVRLKKGGVRFEIACYKNKVLSWRNKIEKDISEVLQSETVFTNVSKGQLARSEDVERVFGTDNLREVCLEILNRGEVQVAEKERDAMHASTVRDIVTIVCEKCINPRTKRPYTAGMIERAMKEVHYVPNEKRSAKQQALELIRALAAFIPIQRAQMRVRVVLPLHDAKTRRERETLHALFASIESESFEGDYSIVGLIEPGAYRRIEEVRSHSHSEHASLEVLDLNVVADDVASAEAAQLDDREVEARLAALTLSDAEASAAAAAAEAAQRAARSAQSNALPAVACPDGTVTFLGSGTATARVVSAAPRDSSQATLQQSRTAARAARRTGRRAGHDDDDDDDPVAREARAMQQLAASADHDEYTGSRRRNQRRRGQQPD